MAVPAAGLAGPAARVEAQSAAAVAKAAPAGGAVESFSLAKVVDIARALAAEAFKPPAPAALDALASATPEEVAAIRYRPSELIWAAGHGLVSLLIVHPSFPWSDREALILGMVDLPLAGLVADRSRATSDRS